jgi:hypothetical protein
MGGCFLTVHLFQQIPKKNNVPLPTGSQACRFRVSVNHNILGGYVSFFVSIRLIEDVLQYDFGVMIPRVFNGLFPILNRFLRAPLEASQALLTSVKP